MGGIKSQHYLDYNVPRVYGKGYLGGTHYSAKLGVYQVWKSMLRRCYSKEYQDNQPTYIGCSVCDEWLNYQNFAKWALYNGYSPELFLDKDLCEKGNKLYSPSTCCFVPKDLNNMLTKSTANRTNLPIGVCKSGNKFQARFAYYDPEKDKQRRSLGVKKTPEEAFGLYKQAKEDYIKKMAIKYKKTLPEKAFNNLMNYTVSIKD